MLYVEFTVYLYKWLDLFSHPLFRYTLFYNQKSVCIYVEILCFCRISVILAVDQENIIQEKLFPCSGVWYKIHKTFSTHKKSFHLMYTLNIMYTFHFQARFPFHQVWNISSDYFFNICHESNSFTWMHRTATDNSS